jgi:3D (Asp-Asp-Asp) domain-containing protein
VNTAIFRSLVLLAAALAVSLLLSSCGTTPTAQLTRQLPNFEPPIAKAEFQTVRTTAYTHTEADHRAFTNHNALGGELHAATPGVRRAEYVPRATAVGDYQARSIDSYLTPHKRVVTKWVKTRRGKKKITVTEYVRPTIGSAAADWSRWPAGTTFRLISTGQIYRVDDYGWALSGRNTIDLYMANRADMNAWGARTEPIQVLRWGDPQASLARLAPHTEHKHIRRMVLELQGQSEAAAILQ